MSKLVRLVGFFRITPPILNVVRSLNANRAVVTKIKRKTYLRTYPTQVILPDGGTVTVKHEVPRHIIRLPVRFDDCSLEKQKYIRLMRQPRGTTTKEEELTTEFDPLKYI